MNLYFVEYSMVYNRIFNTYPMLVHGCGKHHHSPMFNTIKMLNSNCVWNHSACDDFTIVTFRNGRTYNDKDAHTFENSVANAGLSCHVLGQDVSVWRNKLKIPLLKQELQNINTKYVLISDGADVLVVNDLRRLVAEYLSFGCRAVFNAEKNTWPPDLSEDIIAFERAVSINEEFQFLNAGLWITDKAFLAEILDYCLSIEVDTEYQGSEQIYYKYCYKHFHPQIQIDSECRLFQNLYGVDSSMLSVYGYKWL